MARSSEEIIRAEIYYCVSGLVATLANGAGDHDSSAAGTDLAGLAYQALELAAPIADYESAATEAGWRHVGTQSDRCMIFSKGTSITGEDAVYATTWAELCESEDIDPYDRDVYEHWIVSDWLADKLEAKGEKVDRDFAGMTVWARTTTGQSISMDAVMVEIAADLAREYGE